MKNISLLDIFNEKFSWRYESKEFQWHSLDTYTLYDDKDLDK